MKQWLTPTGWRKSDRPQDVVPNRPQDVVPARPQDVVRIGAGASVTVTLKLNDQVLMEHVVAVTNKTIVIEAGPLAVRTTDRITVEARLAR